MPRIVTRGTDTVVLDDLDNEVLVISLGGKLTIGDVASVSITNLTAAFGTADDTVADVGAAFSQATLNNNFQDLTTKVNAILAALRTAGLLT